MGKYAWVGNAVSWVIIFIGWAVVNRQNNDRETRKEVRASLLDLYKHLDSIEDAAFSYHTTTGDKLDARKIKRDIQQISERIKLALRGPMKCNYTKHVAAFRKAITFENFDSSSFAAKTPDDRFFDDLIEAKRNLIAVLERAYSEAYK